MKFTTPAFVRVENPQERKELIEWLVGIGYPSLFSARYNIAPIVACNGYHVRTEEASLENYGYDCGTNIPLFNALAAMNDENDREQWFRVDRSFPGRYDMVGTYELSKVDNFSATQNPETFCSKATAEEIIEHFKN